MLGVRPCAQSLTPNTLRNARRRGGFLERCYACSLANRRARLGCLISNSQVRIVDLQPADISTEFNKSVINTSNTDQRYEEKIAKTWEIVERNMKKAPGPELVARHVLRLIGAVQTPPRITIGDAFQSKIAPLIFRFLPQRIRLWGLKRYYEI